MQYRKLGTTDIEVSTIAFGCWAIIGGFTWGDQDRRDSLAALRMAYDCGVTLFDTAEGYGEGASEELLAEALSDVRDKIVIATKVSPKHFQADSLREACERSLNNLGTDRIDLYQLHWPNWDIPVAETLGLLEQLKQEGKIRAYGLSNFGPLDLKEVTRSEFTVASNQLAYNLLFRAIEYDILPLCRKNNIGVLCYSPLMQGLLTGKFESPDDVPDDRARTRHYFSDRPHARHGGAGAETETFAGVRRIREIAEALGESMTRISLAWLLAQRGVTSVIAGARNAEQARTNILAANLSLDTETVEALAIATQDVKQALGRNADMWQGASRIR